MVERLLLAAGSILVGAKQREASLKSLIYDSNYRYKDRLIAVVMETQRYLPIIERLLEKSGASQNKPLADGLLQVVTYELLFGKGLKGADTGGLRKAIRPYQRGMKDHLQALKEEKDACDSKDLLEKFGIKAREDPVPRYIRVNLLKNSYDEVEAALIDMGYTCVVRRSEVEALISGKEPAEISSMMVGYINSLGPLQFLADLHLPDVAVLSPSKSLFQTSLYRERKVIMMDKASCIPATVLAPPMDSHVIDTCAAPGNKTNHLSCLMQNSGKIFAFDMDEKRTKTLENTLQVSGATNVETQCADFLEVDPDDPKYAQVSHILVDPSCSGSGIVSRKDHLTGKGATRKRLKLLRGLQLRILNHAMKFPSVGKVVYSTCSVYRDENEEVVWRILKENPGFKLVKILPVWDHRPVPITVDRSETANGDGYERDEEYFEYREKIEEQMCKRCVKASFEVDKTNGFFVALFKKSRSSSVGVSGLVGEEAEASLVGRDKEEVVKAPGGLQETSPPQNGVQEKRKKKKRGPRSLGNPLVVREGGSSDEGGVGEKLSLGEGGKSARKRRKSSLGKGALHGKKKRLAAEL